MAPTYTTQFNPLNGAMATGLGPAMPLFQQTLTITASGNSGLISMNGSSACWLSIFAAGTSTGTTPTLDVYYDQQDAAGNLITGVVHAVQLTAGPGATSISFGAAINPLGGVGGGVLLGNTGRVQWVLGGTATPTFPNVTISLIGR
jgi:hypothetical protein